MNSLFTQQQFANLSEWLTYLETAHPVGIEMGLTRIGKVRDALAFTLPGVLFTVGGTNGKGSTCAFLESILIQAGFKVACHTSPHLIDFNERARIQGEIVSDEQLLPHFQAVEAARAQVGVSLTYFEFTTLAITHCFASQSLDAVILEVGLGGRLDAVNLFDADCAIITSIDLDHQAFLGDTREKIGYEKAGIFRTGRPAICADPMPPTSLIDYAREIDADLWLFGRDFNYQGDQQQWSYGGRKQRRNALSYPALRGTNQLLNASAALAALESVADRLPLGAQEFRNGLALVELPGRFQVLPGQPAIVLDVAHNPHAAATLGQNLDNMGFFPNTYAVLGVMQDKDLAGMLKHLQGRVDHFYVCDLPTPRAAAAQDIAEMIRASGFVEDSEHSIECFTSAAVAYEKARSKVADNDRIIVFGSFYTVAAVMQHRLS